MMLFSKPYLRWLKVIKWTINYFNNFKLKIIKKDVKDGDYELEECIKTSIKKYKKKIDDLINRLHLDVNKIDFKNDFKLTLIEEEQHYKDLFKMFEKIKNERKDKYLKLKKKEHELCDLLNENSYSVSDGNSSFI